jgi:hypothetical protein
MSRNTLERGDWSALSAAPPTGAAVTADQAGASALTDEKGDTRSSSRPGPTIR